MATWLGLAICRRTSGARCATPSRPRCAASTTVPDPPPRLVRAATALHQEHMIARARSLRWRVIPRVLVAFLLVVLALPVASASAAAGTAEGARVVAFYGSGAAIVRNEEGQVYGVVY